MSALSSPAAAAIALAAVAAASWVLTGAARRYALARALLDHPNERSSHSVPTPRGGGIAIVAAVVAAVAAGWWAGVVPGGVTAALVGGGAVVAAVGWVDDRGHVNAGVRLLVHFAAVGWALACVGGMPWLTAGAGRVHPGAAGTVIAAFGMVWSINLFNFMDGTDGIAGAQALFAAGAGGALLAAAGHPGLAFASGAVAAAALGFLGWNWAPARIFMGDVGSSFLGFVVAVLAVASEAGRALPILVWVVLMGTFVFDATLTLARRLHAGEKVHAAHRRHLYQRLVQRGWSHRAVCLAYAAANLVLGGLAVTLWRAPRLWAACLVAAVVALAAVYLVVERLAPMYPRPVAPGADERRRGGRRPPVAQRR